MSLLPNRNVTWPQLCSCGCGADVPQYLEVVVPAARLAEVATVLEPHFSVADLLTMSDEELIPIVLTLEKELFGKARFLYCYPLATYCIHGNL